MYYQETSKGRQVVQKWYSSYWVTTGLLLCIKIQCDHLHLELCRSAYFTFLAHCRQIFPNRHCSVLSWGFLSMTPSTQLLSSTLDKSTSMPRHSPYKYVLLLIFSLKLRMTLSLVTGLRPEKQGHKWPPLTQGNVCHAPCGELTPACWESWFWLGQSSFSLQ